MIIKLFFLHFFLITFYIISHSQNDNPFISISQTKLKGHFPFSYEISSAWTYDKYTWNNQSKVFVKESKDNSSPYHDFISFRDDSLIYTLDHDIFNIINLKKKTVESYSIMQFEKYLNTGLNVAIFRPLVTNTFIEPEDSEEKIYQTSANSINDSLILKLTKTRTNIFGKEVIFNNCVWINNSDSLIYKYISNNTEDGKLFATANIAISNYSFNITNYDSIFYEVKELSKNFNQIKKFKEEKDVIKLVQEIESEFTDTFEVRSIDEKISKFNEVSKKRYLLIEFWFPSCGWCKPMAKTMQEIYTEDLNKEVDFIGLEITNKSGEVLKKYASEHDLGFPLFSVLNRAQIDFFRDYPCPTVLLYDSKEKKVVDHFSGYSYKKEGIIKNWLVNLK